VLEYGLQTELCDRYGLTVVVGHYPTGCSKWNPIEHQLFGPISLNWAGQPLSSWEKLLGYIRGTTNKSGLKVSAERIRGNFERGHSLSAGEKAELRVQTEAGSPLWNYTLMPSGLANQSRWALSETGT
jgi:Rhodopirellula transposase DDE domain